MFPWIQAALRFFIFERFAWLLFVGGFYSRAASLFPSINVFVFKLVPSGHASLSTISDKKTQTVSQLQLYCLFRKSLINKVFMCHTTANPTAVLGFVCFVFFYQRRSGFFTVRFGFYSMNYSVNFSAKTKHIYLAQSRRSGSVLVL